MQEAIGLLLFRGLRGVVLFLQKVGSADLSFKPPGAD